jgi:hypothetical protein
MIIRALRKGVRLLWFVTSISPVTVVDINISGALSHLLVMSVVAVIFQTNWALLGGQPANRMLQGIQCATGYSNTYVSRLAFKLNQTVNVKKKKRYVILN